MRNTCIWLGGYDTEGYAHSVFVFGSYAYVADGEGGLAILRVGQHGDLAPPDGYVNLSDLAQLAVHWSEAGCARPEGCNGADLDNDTDVDFADLSIMAAQHRRKGHVLPAIILFGSMVNLSRYQTWSPGKRSFNLTVVTCLIHTHGALKKSKSTRERSNVVTFYSKADITSMLSMLIASCSIPFVGKVYNLKIKETNRYFIGKDRIIVRDY